MYILYSSEQSIQFNCQILFIIVCLSLAILSVKMFLKFVKLRFDSLVFCF